MHLAEEIGLGKTAQTTTLIGMAKARCGASVINQCCAGGSRRYPPCTCCKAEIDVGDKELVNSLGVKAVAGFDVNDLLDFGDTLDIG